MGLWNCGDKKSSCLMAVFSVHNEVSYQRRGVGKKQKNEIITPSNCPLSHCNYPQHASLFLLFSPSSTQKLDYSF